MKKRDKKDKKRKKKGVVDKLIMGAIIGGAIGSAVGMTMAPNKGKETRDFLKSKSKEALEKGDQFLKEHEKEIKAVKKDAKKVWNYFKKKIRKK